MQKCAFVARVRVQITDPVALTWVAALIETVIISIPVTPCRALSP